MYSPPRADDPVARADAAPHVRLFLLGAFRVERGGVFVPDSAWQRPVAATLVKLLALTPGHTLHREHILDLLWPGAAIESALNSFGKALHHARRALEPGLGRGERSRYLHLTHDLLALDPTRVWIDADAFQHLAEEALAGTAVACYEAALCAYGGELLPEMRYEEWVIRRREYLAELASCVRVRLADELEQGGAFDAAERHLQRVLAQDPLHEKAHRRLMHLYAVTGRRQQALRQYQMCRAALRRELDVDPDEDTQELHRLIVTGRIARPATLPAAIQRLPSGPFIGRNQALAFVMDRVAHAARGRGDVILVGGEAGVGKTRLAVEAARAVYQHGHLVLWGASYEQEGPLPYGAVVMALDGYLSASPLDERRTWAAAYPDLAVLLPSLDGGDLLPRSGIDDRMRLFTSIVHLLSDLAARRPALLVFDDLHAADAETLHVFHHLARYAVQRQWLILGTYREEDVNAGSPFHRLTVSATREGLCRRLDLGRLARHDCARLVQDLLSEGMVGQDLLEWFYALSLGNPLYVQEIVRTMRDRGKLILVNGEWRAPTGEMEHVPGGVRSLVEARVTRMDERTQRTLALAAVSGMDISFTVLRQAGLALHPPLTEEALLDALDRALEARILEEQADAYAFQHPLLRSTLYERLSSQRRRQLHGVLARAIRQVTPDDVDALAYHYSRSNNWRDAVTYLIHAGDRAASIYANDAALCHYRAARDMIERHQAEGAVRASLDAKLGDLLLLTGDFVAAQESFARARGSETDVTRRAELWIKEGVSRERRGDYEQALAAFDAAEAVCDTPPSPIVAALADLHRGSVYYRQGAFERAEATARRALAVLGDGDTDTDVVLAAHIARGHNLRGNVCYYRGAYSAAKEHYMRSLAIRERIDDRQGCASTWMNLGNIAYYQGDYTGAEQCHRRSLAIREQIGDQQGISDALNNLGNVAYRRVDLSQAEDFHRRSLAIKERVGDRWGIAASWNNLGEVATDQGHYDEAEERYGRAQELWERLEDHFGVAHTWANLGDVAHRRGDLVQADIRWRRSLAIRESIGDQQGLAECWIALGEIACDRGDLGAATALCRRGRILARSNNAYETMAHALLGQARTQLRANRPWRAAVFIARGKTLAAVHHLPRVALHASLLSSESCLIDGAAAEAEAVAAETVHRAAAMGLLPIEAAASRLLGRSVLASARLAEAMPALERALVIQEKIGAALELARTRLVLAQAAQELSIQDIPSLLSLARLACSTSGATLDLLEVRQLEAIYQAHRRSPA